LSTSGSSKDKAVETFKLPPPIPTHPSKEILEKSKFFGKGKKKMIMNKALQNKLYTQTVSPSVSEISKANVLLKRKPRHLHMSSSYKMEPSRKVRFKEGGLNLLFDLEK